MLPFLNRESDSDIESEVVLLKKLLAILELLFAPSGFVKAVMLKQNPDQVELEQNTIPIGVPPSSDVAEMQ